MNLHPGGKLWEGVCFERFPHYLRSMRVLSKIGHPCGAITFTTKFIVLLYRVENTADVHKMYVSPFSDRTLNDEPDCFTEFNMSVI